MNWIGGPMVAHLEQAWRQLVIRITRLASHIRMGLVDRHFMPDQLSDREGRRRKARYNVFDRISQPGELWIETGTYLGDTSSFLSTIASMVVTIEPDPNLYAAAEKRFRNNDRVRVVRGTTEEMLESVLTEWAVGRDVSLFLDGHYSEGITFKGPVACPIEHELATIQKCRPSLGRVTVYIDDYEHFSHDDDQGQVPGSYPALHVLTDFAQKLGATTHVEAGMFVVKSER